MRPTPLPHFHANRHTAISVPIRWPKCQHSENPQQNNLKLFCWDFHNTTVLSCCVVGFLDVGTSGPPYAEMFHVSPHDAILARRYMLSSRISVCPSAVRLSQAGIVSKHLGRIEMVLAWILPSTFRCMPIRKFGFFQKWGYFPLELCPKLWTLKMSPRKVDRVVNVTRRRSSLLATFATVLSTRRGCLLHVRQP